MITIGFTMLGQGRWSGGENYLRNTLSVIGDLLQGRVEAKLFLSPRQAEEVGSSFDHLLSEPAIVDDRVEGVGAGRRGVTALLFGSDRAFGSLVVKHKIDVMFENAIWLGGRFPTAVLSWLPDFQHALLPQLFPVVSRFKRDMGFRLQCASNRVIMLSSNDAVRDCERLYPASLGKTAVVKFSANIDPEQYLARSTEIIARYGLPKTYFFLPNQFWTHKNHVLVVDALTILGERLERTARPTVVMTGRTEDPRDPGLFDRVMAKAKNAGLANDFRHLGQVPFEDVYGLMAGAAAMINTSRFEGWSTPVEEAKALGTPMLLSNINVHREQAASAQFFSLTDPNELADLLERTVTAPEQQHVDLASLRAATHARRQQHASELLAAITKAQKRGA
jgi:glycosyltransferase involved in cell wall biosynthesis